jgi:hypothetical protein
VSEGRTQNKGCQLNNAAVTELAGLATPVVGGCTRHRVRGTPHQRALFLIRRRRE